jgi:hypothetical protein
VVQEKRQLEHGEWMGIGEIMGLLETVDKRIDQKFGRIP